MTAGQIGEISELRVLLKLKELQYQVFRDTNPVGRIDYLIQCDGDQYIKLQVKTVSMNKKGYKIIHMRHSGYRKYSKDYVDFFIGVYGGDFYIIPYHVVGEKCVFSVSRMASFLNNWDLLPSPSRSVGFEVIEINQQGMAI